MKCPLCSNDIIGDPYTHLFTWHDDKVNVFQLYLAMCSLANRLEKLEEECICIDKNAVPHDSYKPVWTTFNEDQ